MACDCFCGVIHWQENRALNEIAMSAMTTAERLAADLKALASADAAGRLNPVDVAPVALVVAVPAPLVASPPQPSTSATAPLALSTEPSSAEPDETAAEEISRLEASLGALTQAHERVCVQNIALLADLEAAHRAVRELRADKDALAVHLKRLLP